MGDVQRQYQYDAAYDDGLNFYVAEYDQSAQQHAGGGLIAEGEDIAVLELTLDDALAMIDRGEIIDAKTIMLLQHAALKGLCRPRL